MTTAIHTCASELGRDGISAEIYDSGYMETGVTVSCNRCGEACDELISYEPAESERHGRFGACTDDGGELCAACESRTTGDSEDSEELDCDCDRYSYCLETALDGFEHECDWPDSLGSARRFNPYMLDDGDTIDSLTELAHYWFDEDRVPTEPSERYYLPSLLGAGDYSGGSVQVANRRAFLAQFGERPGVFTTYSGYGYLGVAIRESAIDPDMYEIFRSLDDYPLIDEEMHSTVEMEAENEAWDSWARDDFRRALTVKFPDSEETIDALSDDALYELFRTACDESNTYWENEEGNNAYIDLDRIVTAIESV